MPFKIVRNDITRCERYDAITCGVYGCMMHTACTVWQCAFEHRVLSVKNTGTDVGGRNDRQCRLWIHLWSLYANL